MLERDREIAGLDAVVASARDGVGRLAVVEGAAGTGKSTLLAATLARARDAGCAVLTARGGELEREFPFGVMRQLYEPALGAGARERLLVGPAAWAPHALGLDGRASAGVPEGEAALHALYWLTINLAGSGAVVFAIDDLQWADVSSLRAIDYLARRIAELPVAMLVALRPGEPHAAARVLDGLLYAPGTARTTLGPLSREAVARIVHERLAGADGRASEAAYVATAGNPLYLEELLRSLTLDAPASGAGPGALDAEDVAIPSLGERVLRRIERVAPRAAALAQAMAVLGDGTRLAAAAALAAMPEDEAGEVAHRLRRIEVLGSEDPFAFVHPLVRRSVYDAIPATERERAHRAAAELLGEAGAPAEAVAVHLAALPPSGSERVARGLVAAGDRAVAQAAQDEAARWFRRALEEDADQPPAVGILVRLGMAEATLRDGGAVGHLRQALARAGGGAERARIAATLGELLVLSGEWPEAMAVVRACRREVGDRDEESFAVLAAIELMLSRYSPALAATSDLDPRRLLEVAHGSGRAAHALAAALAAATAHAGEAPERVLALVDRALEGGVLLDEAVSGRWPIANVLIALAHVDAYDRALELSDAVGDAARRRGSVSTVFLAADHRGWILARKGDLAGAEAELRPGVEMTRAAPMPTALATQLFYLQDPLLERPGLGDLASLAESFEVGPHLEGSWHHAALVVTRGRLRLVRREREAGLRDLRLGVQVTEALGFSPTVWPVRSALALALPPAERDRALALVDEELELARVTGLPRPEGVALRAAGLLAGAERGVEQLRESVALLAPSPAKLEHARSLVELGAALRRSRRRGDAREPLEAGLALARTCGAHRLVLRARDELVAAGGRPPPGLGRGVEALTASELRVARLAAAGATNAEIAQELYVTPKTVETHLSNAYAKLALSGRGSRGRLADALQVQDRP